jgi:hypothetical protein
MTDFNFVESGGLSIRRFLSPHRETAFSGQADTGLPDLD